MRNPYTPKSYFQRSIWFAHLTKFRPQKKTFRRLPLPTPFGLFEFQFMTFGLRNAAQTFQRFMDEVLQGLGFCYPYIDDILVASASPEEHLQHLETVFQRLRQYSLVINPMKCVFGQPEVKFHKTSKQSSASRSQIQYLHMVEARSFTIYTDHKPITYAFRKKNTESSPRQIGTTPGLHQSIHD